jgi:hypothetical protein
MKRTTPSALSRTARLAAAILCGSAFPLGIAAAAESPELAALAEQLNRLRAEVGELRHENESLRQHLGVVESSAAKAAPAAAPALRLGGELRLRYEGFYGRNSAFVDRNRNRLRLRLGGTADLPGNVELGLRLTTGVMEGEPTGNNATWQDNASKKAFALDLAYAKWTPLKTPVASLALIGGKMNLPFTSSDLVFDGDYTPEGLALQYARTVAEGQVLRFNAAQFVLDEVSNSAHDPLLHGGQLRWDSVWSPQWGTSFGASLFDISNAARLTNSAVPDVHKGNTRTAAGVLVNDYHPWVLDAALVRTFDAVTGYPGACPVKLFGDYLCNPGADTDNRGYFAGLALGKAAKKGTWDFTYRYRVIQSDAWYEELADSDSGAFYQTAPAGGASGYGGGTNVRGHIFQGNYALNDAALVGFTYFATRLIHPSPAGSESAMGRLQVNTILKF